MRDPEELIKRFKSRVHVLDGGLATELEKRGHDISGKLWSAQVLLDDPGAIEQLHYDYLKAGADIIITSSYQLTFQGMTAEGYSHKQSEDALWKSVEVAVKARDRYLSELDEDLPEDRKPLIAASIGPYGAYLADGSEYTGKYSISHEHTSDSCGALMIFHKLRVEFLARSDADFIAMETIPSKEEASALKMIGGSLPETPFWMTFSCRSPSTISDGSDVMDTLYGGIATGLRGDGNLIGVGVNCSPPEYVAQLVHEFHTQLNPEIVPLPPVVIAYPNSGEGWDAEHRCWVGENDAEHFAEHAREWIKAGANIIGGCCRTGPEHIAQLRKLVDSL